ncbi:MAG: CHAT domain-containing protein [Pseudonocardiaceae bacterium]
MTTLDLELEIGRNTGGSYPVIARAEGQVATSWLPSTSAVLTSQLGSIQAEVPASSQAGVAAPEDEQSVRDWGQQLFETLIIDEVRDLYVTSRRRSREQGSTIRLILRVRAAELAWLPWEFMFDPDWRDYLGVRLSLVRHPEVLVPRQPLPASVPLRILGMVVPVGQEELDEQRQRLDAALAGWEREGLVELEWVAGQTSGDLKRALYGGPWHAFHFIGHGFDDLSQLLAEHHPLRLVVLNGRGSADPSGPSTGVGGAAGALLRQGIPAVVAMQFEISDPAAVRFAQTLYHSVATRLPVDIGVLRARRAVRQADKGTLEWGTPVLYLRAPEGHIFTATPAPGSLGEQTDASEPATRYEQALDAFWSEQWDQAAELFQQVLVHHPDHPDAAAKLEQAGRERDLATRYAHACISLETGDWAQAIVGFTMVTDADPTKLDAFDRLADARRKQEAAALLAKARREPPAPPPPRLEPRPQARQILYTRKEVNAVAFSPDGRWLATAGSKNIAQIWGTSRGREFLSVGSTTWRRNMEAVVFSPDGGRLATASGDRTARIWDAASGEELLKINHDGPVWSVAFSPDGSRLATAGDDCTARIWDAASGEELLKVSHENWVRDLAFSPDGRWLATAGVDRTARVWDVADGEELAKVTHDSLVVGTAFSPDGRWLATASHDCTARIWDADSGEEQLKVAHDNLVVDVAFSPDGRWLATASHDCTAQVWDLTDEQEPATVIHADQVWGVAFSPDGSWLATASADRTARIWALIAETTRSSG